MNDRFMNFISLVALGTGLLFVPSFANAKVVATKDKELSPRKIGVLVHRVSPKTPDAKGWGADIADALARRKYKASRRNVCAIMGIVALESGFEADPVRVSFGPRAIKALQGKLHHLPGFARKRVDRWLHEHPDPAHSYYDRIGAATTERQLDMTYREMVDALLKGRLARLKKIGLIGEWIARLNAIDSVGAMQVAVALVVAEEEKKKGRRLRLAEIWKLRDGLYERRGSLYYGIPNLLGHDPGTSDVRFRFADYNAGRYASRNAAFQMIVAQLSEHKLTLDGDLLRYRKSGRPTSRRGNTEKTLLKLAKKYRLGLGRRQIRKDLVKEKQAGLTKTRTWQAVHALYQKQTGKTAPVVIMPRIAVKSDKKVNFSTTKDYAQTANKTYMRCMAGRL